MDGSSMYVWTQLVLHEWVELLMQSPHPTGAIVVSRRCFVRKAFSLSRLVGAQWLQFQAGRGGGVIIERDWAFSPRKIFERGRYLESSCQIIDMYPILVADSATILSFLWTPKFSFFIFCISAYCTCFGCTDHRVCQTCKYKSALLNQIKLVSNRDMLLTWLKMFSCKDWNSLWLSIPPYLYIGAFLFICRTLFLI